MRRNNEREVYNPNARRVRPRIIDPDPNQENSQNPFAELRRNTAIQESIESEVLPQEIINNAPQSSQQRRLTPKRDVIASHLEMLEQLNEEKLRQERNKQEIRKERNKQEIRKERDELEKELENALLNLERQNPVTQQEQPQLLNQASFNTDEIKISTGERLLPENGGGGFGSKGKGVVGVSTI